MKVGMRVFVLCVIAIAAMAQENTQHQDTQAPAQGQGQPERRLQGMRRFGRGGVVGEITAANAEGFTLKTMQGSSATVKLQATTRIYRDQKEIKASDLKVGDTIGVQGTPDTSDPTTWNANFIQDRTAQFKQMKESMGKTMIAGEVKSVDGTKITVLRPDGETQTIEVDENTSFERGREKITLADIKAGDRIFGRGALKDGVFVPTELRAGGFGGGMMGGGPGEGYGGAPGAPAPPGPRVKANPQAPAAGDPKAQPQ